MQNNLSQESRGAVVMDAVGKHELEMRFAPITLGLLLFLQKGLEQGVPLEETITAQQALYASKGEVLEKINVACAWIRQNQEALKLSFS